MEKIKWFNLPSCFIRCQTVFYFHSFTYSFPAFPDTYPVSLHAFLTSYRNNFFPQCYSTLRHLWGWTGFSDVDNGFSKTPLTLLKTSIWDMGRQPVTFHFLVKALVTITCREIGMSYPREAVCSSTPHCSVFAQNILHKMTRSPQTYIRVYMNVFQN